MASGSSHDCATWWLGLAFGLLCWPVLGWIGSCTGALAFLIGGLLLSPDLDTISRPTRRWGPLQLLWWPYRSLFKHRSLFSHSPVLGTGGAPRLPRWLGIGIGMAAGTVGSSNSRGPVPMGPTAVEPASGPGAPDPGRPGSQRLVASDPGWGSDPQTSPAFASAEPAKPASIQTEATKAKRPASLIHVQHPAAVSAWN